MTDADTARAELAVPREAVDECAGGSYWSVSGCGWDGNRASLPAEFAALLAPPIVVGAAALAPAALAPAALAPAGRPAEPVPARPVPARPVPCQHPAEPVRSEPVPWQPAAVRSEPVPWQPAAVRSEPFLAEPFLAEPAWDDLAEVGADPALAEPVLARQILAEQRARRGGPPVRREGAPGRGNLDRVIFQPNVPMVAPAPPRPPGRHRRRG